MALNRNALIGLAAGLCWGAAAGGLMERYIFAPMVAEHTMKPGSQLNDWDNGGSIDHHNEFFGSRLTEANPAPARFAFETIDMTEGRKCQYGRGEGTMADPADWDEPQTQLRVLWCKPKPVFQGGAWRTGGMPNPRSPHWQTHRPEDG